MPIKIRLRRMGRKKQPHYRIVVAESLAPRDGRFLETVGFYDPLPQPARLAVNQERVAYWLERGAIPTETVAQLLKKAQKGGDEKVAVVEAAPARAGKASPGESPVVQGEVGGEGGVGDSSGAGTGSEGSPQESVLS